MVTTTYHTSSSDSSLISLTDKEVIYKKKTQITFTLERGRKKKKKKKKKKKRERERERKREGEITH